MLDRDLQAMSHHVLAGILFHNYPMEKIHPSFDENCFPDSYDSKLYKNITAYYDKNSKTDFVEILSETEWIARISEYDSEYISDDLNSGYIDKLISYRNRRNIIRIANELNVKLAYDYTNTEDEILSNYLLELQKTLIKNTSNLKSLSELLVIANEKLQLIINGAPESQYLSGFKNLDDKWKITRGDLHIICARTGMGKSVLAYQIAKNLSNLKFKCLFFSVEMSREQIALRTMAMDSTSTLTNIMSVNLSPDDISNIKQLSTNPKYNYLIVCDTGGINISEIIKISKQQLPDIIFIDYLQLINASNIIKREEQIASISRRLKQLAKDLNIPIIAVAQLSRKVEERNDKRPKLSDLRESGSLEMDADSVISIYRDDYYKDLNEPNDHTAVIEILKQRMGSTGFCKLSFIPDKVKFTE